MKQILCFSDQPWSSSPGRTQQLLSRLKDCQILYFSPAPQKGGRDQKGVKVRPNITAYTLPPILHVEERHRLLFRAEQQRIARFVGDKMARHRFRSPLLWATGPDQVHLLDRVEYGGLVYDCDRFWNGYPPLWEESLCRAADVVFAASPTLARRLSPHNPNVALLPSGVNYPLFSGENAPTGTDPLAECTGPVVGWTGAVHADLDLEPLLYAARELPEWTFLLLGPRAGHPLLPRLQRQPNIKLAGPCPLSQVPDWLAGCHVLVDFQRLSRPEDMITQRMYEYLATGKPVVAMHYPEQVELFPDVVYAAHSPQEFVTLCRHALEEAPGLADRRRSHAQSAAWPQRSAEVDRILRMAGLL